MKFSIKIWLSLLANEEQILSWRKKYWLNSKQLFNLKTRIWAQALNYLKAYKLEVGLLINFGSKSLTFKRLVLTQNHLINEENQRNPIIRIHPGSNEVHGSLIGFDLDVI